LWYKEGFAEALAILFGEKRECKLSIGQDCDFARVYSAPFLSDAPKNKKRGKKLVSFRLVF
jgi:hypothetical protein